MRVTFKVKALAIMIPVLTVMSLVHTYVSINSEKEMVRGQIIKRAETMTTLATKTGELPILSGNAELLKGTYGGVLRHEDLRVKSAYNTYRYPGLPPGPIANPGKSSLEAALHPAATGLYYFVSDGNGNHRFSHGLEEHNRNVTAYRKIRRIR